jgi:D-aminopeptidase
MALDRRAFLGLTAVAAASGVATLAGQPARAGAEIVGRRRARDLGLHLGRMVPGAGNAITDVPGVRVGHATVIAGEGAWRPGVGPVRTGVTAVLPNTDIGATTVAAGVAVPNGNGELTGLQTIERLGVVASPILLTGTSHVGVVYDALVDVLAAHGPVPPTPVVGETWDGSLSDVAGRYLGAEQVRSALALATGGPVAEGAVGGGTGMICYGFKGGIGTASRRLPPPLDGRHVGVLVQANHGRREMLRIDGVAVGEALADWRGGPPAAPPSGVNSILIVIATDVPLLDFELARVARRAVHGLARTGSISSNSSGDFALAFSTANAVGWRELLGDGRLTWRTVDQGAIEPVLQATAEATEEAIVNALCMATDMVGLDGVPVPALPLAEVVALLAAHGRTSAALPRGGGAGG